MRRETQAERDTRVAEELLWIVLIAHAVALPFAILAIELTR